MAKKTDVKFAYAVLTPELVAGVQQVFEGQDAARTSAHDVAVALYDLGIQPDALMVPTKAKPNPQFNEGLWGDIVHATITSKRFGERGREVIVRKLAGLTPANADESTARRIEMGKVNAVVHQIRKALAIAHETGGDTRKPFTLHEALDDILKRGLDMIQKKGDKGNAPVAELQAAWRDCRSKTNALFKGSK